MPALSVDLWNLIYIVLKAAMGKNSEFICDWKLLYQLLLWLIIVLTELLSHYEHIYECFLEGLAEYTLDSRGDIGAWVREAAMTGLQVCTCVPF